MHDLTMAATKPTSPPDAPTKTLAEIGEEAKRRAQRKHLLAELRRQSWNLTATGAAVGIPNVSNLIRTIRALDLGDEYEAAKKAGKIPKGPRS